MLVEEVSKVVEVHCLVIRTVHGSFERLLSAVAETFAIIRYAQQRVRLGGLWVERSRHGQFRDSCIQICGIEEGAALLEMFDGGCLIAGPGVFSGSIFYHRGVVDLSGRRTFEFPGILL